MDKDQARTLRETIPNILGADAAYVLLVEAPDGESVELIHADGVGPSQASLMMVTVLTGLGVVDVELPTPTVEHGPETRGPTGDN